MPSRVLNRTHNNRQVYRSEIFIKNIDLLLKYLTKNFMNIKRTNAYKSNRFWPKILMFVCHKSITKMISYLSKQCAALRSQRFWIIDAPQIVMAPFITCAKYGNCPSLASVPFVTRLCAASKIQSLVRTRRGRLLRVLRKRIFRKQNIDN